MISHKKNNKVVYLHKKKGTDEVVYVGIGSPSRPFNFDQRSDFWKKVHNKYGIDVEIIHSDLTWDEACKIEIELIAQYGRRDLGTGCLVNMTAGGDGMNGYKHTEEHKKSISGPNNHNWKEDKVRVDRPKGGWPKSTLKGDKYPWLKTGYRERSDSRKLSSDLAEAIRALYVPRSKHANANVLAKKFGITRQAVLKIIHGTTYRQ